MMRYIYANIDSINPASVSASLVVNRLSCNRLQKDQRRAPSSGGASPPLMTRDGQVISRIIMPVVYFFPFFHF